MKAVVFALLVISTQTFHTADVGFSRVPTPSELLVGGPYDRCVVLLEKILLEANEIAGFVTKKEWHRVVPMAIKLSKDIYDDIQCWQHPSLSAPQILGLKNDPYECIMKHIRAAAEAIQAAIDALQQKDIREAVLQVLKAVAHIHEAQLCQ